MLLMCVVYIYAGHTYKAWQKEFQTLHDGANALRLCIEHQCTYLLPIYLIYLHLNSNCIKDKTCIQFVSWHVNK